jgi:glucuronate isomerase
LADLLGYHYYTELAHSAGMPKGDIEAADIGPRELVARLVNHLKPLENTAQYFWLIQICRKFFDFDGDRIDASNWERLYETAERRMSQADWPQTVLDLSNVEAVFLTNDFDDSLTNFDTETYIPCLRTDDLVFHLAKDRTRQRLETCTGIELSGSITTLRQCLSQRFAHFVSRGARACAISLPPGFTPTPVSDGRAGTAWEHVLRQGALVDNAHASALSRYVFWTLAELCDEYRLPFDLMIGVNRGVYTDGVFQGQDLYDSRVSLIQYRELFNAFPRVPFPISVLASVTNQELVSYAWIFPNVYTNGHWWYSNTPSFITRDAAARLEAVPQTKQIAYYSDAYKLEFVWPKFDMYRRLLAGILANHFVRQCGWSETRAVELGYQVLRANVDQIFPKRGGLAEEKSTRASIPAKEDEFTARGQRGPAEFALGGSGAAAISEFATEVDSGFVLPDDPVPSAIELDALDIADTELRSTTAEAPAFERELIERDLDTIPLNVGDLFGDQDEADSQVRLLRGEHSFVADEESLQLQTNPITGELMLQLPDKDADEADHDLTIIDSDDVWTSDDDEDPLERE